MKVWHAAQRNILTLPELSECTLQYAICLTDSFVFLIGDCGVKVGEGIMYKSTGFSRIVSDKSHLVRLLLHGAISRSDSFLLMLGYCANLKAIRYESTSLNRIVADKSHHVIVA